MALNFKFSICTVSVH